MKTTAENLAQSFYEACRITSKYDQLKEILVALELALKEADATVKSRLCTDFAELIPVDESERAIKGIIRWCLRHEFLQQAVTMTAEWFPRYLFSAGIVKVIDQEVYKQNEEQRQAWDTWTGHIFKNYNPYENVSAENLELEIDLDHLTVKNLRNIVVSCDYSCWECYKTIQGHNPALEQFLQSLARVNLDYPAHIFPQYVIGLHPKNSIRMICEDKYNYPQKDILEKFIKRGVAKSKTPAHFVLSIIPHSKEELLRKLFNLYGEKKARKAKTDDETLAKITARKSVFERLLAENKLSVNNKTKFLELVVAHLTIVEFYRNRMNHGVIEFKGQEGNREIALEVEELLKLAEELEK